MLKAYACRNGTLMSVDASDPAGAIWFDLQDPTPEEYAQVTRETGLALPRHEDLTEIENSARLSADGPVLTLSMPIVTRVEEMLRSSACGFVLCPRPAGDPALCPEQGVSRGLPASRTKPVRRASRNQRSSSSACWRRSSTGRPMCWRNCARSSMNCPTRFFTTAWAAKGAMASRGGAMRRPSCKRSSLRWGAITTPSRFCATPARRCPHRSLC